MATTGQSEKPVGFFLLLDLLLGQAEKPFEQTPRRVFRVEGTRPEPWGCRGDKTQPVIWASDHRRNLTDRRLVAKRINSGGGKLFHLLQPPLLGTLGQPFPPWGFG